MKKTTSWITSQLKVSQETAQQTYRSVRSNSTSFIPIKELNYNHTQARAYGIPLVRGNMYKKHSTSLLRRGNNSPPSIGLGKQGPRHCAQRKPPSDTTIHIRIAPDHRRKKAPSLNTTAITLPARDNVDYRPAIVMTAAAASYTARQIQSTHRGAERNEQSYRGLRLIFSPYVAQINVFGEDERAGTGSDVKGATLGAPRDVNAAIGVIKRCAAPR